MHHDPSNVWFFLPLADGVGLPEDIEQFWQWQTTTPGLGEFWGPYHWILQTYLRLRQHGFPCRFARQMPPTGVVIAHHNHLPENLRPSPNRLVVSALVDKPASQAKVCDLYVVHNRLQERQDPGRSFYIPSWPQVGLIPRSRERGTRFENAAFFGYPRQLPAELKSDAFRQRLLSAGLAWQMREQTHWHDFSDIDVIVAVRTLGTSQSHPNKSVLKLVNAWLAEVPAILGYESAFREVGRRNKDYIEARTPDEILHAVQQLKSNIEFRNMLVENGKARAAEFAAESVLERWQTFLAHVAIPQYRKRRRVARIERFLRKLPLYPAARSVKQKLSRILR